MRLCTRRALPTSLICVSLIKRSFVADRPDWMKTFLEKGFFNDQKIFQEQINTLAENERCQFFLSNAPKSDHERCLMYQNLWHFNINMHRKGDHVNMCAFAGEVHNDEILNMYANEQKDLDRFALSFVAMRPHLQGAAVQDHLIETHITLPELNRGGVNLTIDFLWRRVW